MYSLEGLSKLRSHRRRWVSSYDRTGGNWDFTFVPAGETAVLAEREGAGKVNLIKVTMEHGYANHRSDDYSSTAYGYLTEPHKPLRPPPPVEKRFPRDGYGTIGMHAPYARKRDIKFWLARGL